MSILIDRMAKVDANLPIAMYLSELIDDLDGMGLVITDFDLVHEQLAKMMDTGFPVLRGLLKSSLRTIGPRYDVVTSIPEAQEPVKCGNCGWIGFESELEPCTVGEADHCPRCFSNNDIGSVLAAANVDPVYVNCGLCRWNGTDDQLINVLGGFSLNAPSCPKCGSCAFIER